MSAFDRYIFRTTFGAFLLVLISLTAVIWLTHALREIDLMTNQRQTILVFIGITGLLIPLLVLVIAPIALVIAVSYTLNKLNGDSEIVVMTAAGMSPWRMFRPFLVVASLVAAMVAVLRAYGAPKVLPGPLSDGRGGAPEPASFLAEKGEILENDRGTFLVLVNGSVQRREPTQR